MNNQIASRQPFRVLTIFLLCLLVTVAFTPSLHAEQARYPEQSQPIQQQMTGRPTGGSPALETYFVPAVSIYSDAAGFSTKAGVTTGLRELFGLETLLGDVLLGVLVRYDGLLTGVDDYTVNTVGPAVSLGYRFRPGGYFPNAGIVSRLRVVPHLTTGAMHHSRERLDRSVYSGFSYYLAPGVTADLQLPTMKRLRLGLATEFNFLFSDTDVNSFGIGPFVSFTF